MMRHPFWLLWFVLASAPVLATAQRSLPEPDLESLCRYGDALEPGAVPDDFMWGVTASHVVLPGYELYPDPATAAAYPQLYPAGELVGFDGAAPVLPAEFAGDFTRLAAQGIEWIRVDFAWALIEPTRDAPFDFAYFDMIVAEAERAGLGIIAQLGAGYNGTRPIAPGWTAGLDVVAYTAELGAYAQATVARYAEAIDYWALENELHLDIAHVLEGSRVRQWSLLAENRIIRTLNAAVREQDPEAYTILTAVAVPTYLNYLLRLAPQIDYDFVGLYNYPSIAEPRTSGFDGSFCVTSALARLVSGGRPVILLETGFRSEGAPGEGRTLENQAAFLESAAAAAIRAGAVGFFWYEYLDNPGEPTERQRSSGLVEEDRSPKPSWAAYRRVIEQFDTP